MPPSPSEGKAVTSPREGLPAWGYRPTLGKGQKPAWQVGEPRKAALRGLWA